MRLGGEIGSASQSAAKLCVVVVMSSEVLLELGEVSVGSVQCRVRSRLCGSSSLPCGA